MPANLINVPSLRSELLQSTALTPTYHKSKGLSIVIGVVAGIATSGLGTALTGAIGGSLAVNTAIIGAGVGALGAAITGGDPLLGAVAGGFGGFVSGGGIGEIFGPTAGITGGAGPGSFGALPVEQAFGPGSFSPLGAVDAIRVAAPGPITTAVSAPFITDSLGTAADFADFAGPSFVDPAGVGEFTGGFADFETSTFNAAPEINTTPFGLQFIEQVPAGTSGAGGGAGGGGTSPPPAEKAFEFSDLLPTAKEFRTQALSGIGKLAINALTGALEEAPPQTPQEQKATVLRDRALERQSDLQTEKRDIARQFATQAAAISPDQQGQLLFAAERERFGKLAREQERRLAPNQTGELAAFRRRNLLRQSQLGGFQRGRELGQAQQRGLLAAGAAALPTGAGLTSSTQAALDDAERGFLRQQKENKNRAELFAGLLPNPEVLTAAEREARRRQAGLVG